MKPAPVFLIVVIAVAVVTHSVVAGILLGAVAVGAWWWRDVRRNPRVRCRACNGSGDNKSRFYVPGVTRQPAGACGKCGGKKGAPRMALRIVHPEARKRMLNETASARKKIGK